MEATTGEGTAISIRNQHVLLTTIAHCPLPLCRVGTAGESQQLFIILLHCIHLEPDNIGR